MDNLSELTAAPKGPALAAEGVRQLEVEAVNSSASRALYKAALCAAEEGLSAERLRYLPPPNGA